jgi:hypothetical protein
MALDGTAAPVTDMDFDMDIDLGLEPEPEPIQMVSTTEGLKSCSPITDICQLLGRTPNLEPG